MSRRIALLISSGLSVFVLVLGVGIIANIQAGSRGAPATFLTDASTVALADQGSFQPADSAGQGVVAANELSRVTEHRKAEKEAHERGRVGELRDDRRGSAAQRVEPSHRVEREHDEDDDD